MTPAVAVKCRTDRRKSNKAKQMPSLDTGRRRRAHLDLVKMTSEHDACHPAEFLDYGTSTRKRMQTRFRPKQPLGNRPLHGDARLIFTVPRRRSTCALANSEPRTGNINPTRGLDVCFVAQRITQTLVKQCLDEHTRTHVRMCWEAPSMRTGQHATPRIYKKHMTKQVCDRTPSQNKRNNKYSSHGHSAAFVRNTENARHNATDRRLHVNMSQNSQSPTNK